MILLTKRYYFVRSVNEGS